jgi:predicted transcriptional regulator
MKGHNDKPKLDTIIKLRVEPELKQKVEQLAKRGRKATAQLLRETLWRIVEEDEKRGGQEELPLPVATGTGR